MRLKTIIKTTIAAAALSGAVLQAEAGTPITTPTTMPVSGAVNNDITIMVSGTDLGKFSVTGAPLDTATASFTPGGSVTNGPGTGMGVGSIHPASFVWDPSHLPQTPTVQLSAGFHNAALMVTYGNVVNLSCAGGGTIRITHITDDLSVPTVWDKPGPAAATSTPGHDTLDNAGEKTFHIGMSLATSSGSTYSDGLCTGSFTFTVEYG